MLRVTERVFDCVCKNGHGSSYFYCIASSGRNRNYSAPSPERASENQLLFGCLLLLANNNPRGGHAKWR